MSEIDKQDETVYISPDGKVTGTDGANYYFDSQGRLTLIRYHLGAEFHFDYPNPDTVTEKNVVDGVMDGRNFENWKFSESVRHSDNGNLICTYGHADTGGSVELVTTIAKPDGSRDLWVTIDFNSKFMNMDEAQVFIEQLIASNASKKFSDVRCYRGESCHWQVSKPTKDGTTVTSGGIDGRGNKTTGRIEWRNKRGQIYEYVSAYEANGDGYLANGKLKHHSYTYKFDDKGNWITRSESIEADTPNGVQFKPTGNVYSRHIEYYR